MGVNGGKGRVVTETFTDGGQTVPALPRSKSTPISLSIDLEFYLHSLPLLPYANNFLFPWGNLASAEGLGDAGPAPLYNGTLAGE